MSTDDRDRVPALREYLAAHAAPRFGAMLAEAQERLAAAQKEVAELRAARGTVRWCVEGAAAVYLNLADGVMAVSDAAADAPFMTVVLGADDWQRFAAGGVPVGFFENRGARRRFGQTRIDRLRAVRGTVRFLFTGLPDGSDWTCTAAFGGEPAAEPHATVTIGADVVAQIQDGRLDPQAAFLQGQVRVNGNASLVMQLGMAMFM